MHTVVVITLQTLTLKIGLLGLSKLSFGIVKIVNRGCQNCHYGLLKLLLGIDRIIR